MSLTKPPARPTCAACTARSPSDEDEISYTIAGDAIDQKLFELIQKRFPQAQITVNMCKQMKEGS